MLLLSTTAMAQTATEKKAGRTAESVSYFLPKTAIQLNLLVEKKVYTPGEFCKYADKYLRLSGIGQEEEITNTVVRYGLTQIGMRDTSKFYTVHLAGKTLNADIRMDAEGVLQAVNDEPAELKMPKPFVPAPKPTPINPRHYLMLREWTSFTESSPRKRRNFRRRLSLFVTRGSSSRRSRRSTEISKSRSVCSRTRPLYWRFDSRTGFADTLSRLLCPLRFQPGTGC